MAHTRGVSTSSQSRRFRDPRSTEYDFLGDIHVTCPNCAKGARVIPGSRDPEAGHRPAFAPRRLVCRHCGLVKATLSRHLVFLRGTTRGMTDPYFGTPLRLQIETRHGWLWAYSPEHLTLIRHYVAATLRERTPSCDTGWKMTLVARLPRWIKNAKNRDEVLRAIDRIRTSLTAD